MNLLTWLERSTAGACLGTNASAALLAAVAIGLSGCGGGSDGDSTIVVFRDNLFEPRSISVPVGQRVTFRYENGGTIVHNMMIVLSDEAEGQHFASPGAVAPGDTGEFQVTFTGAGKFEFVCTLHLPDMVGVITAQ